MASTRLSRRSTEALSLEAGASSGFSLEEASTDISQVPRIPAFREARRGGRKTHYHSKLVSEHECSSPFAIQLPHCRRQESAGALCSLLGRSASHRCLEVAGRLARTAEQASN